MPSTFRIPRATISGPYGRLLLAYARRTWGKVPDTAYVVWHHRQVMNAVLAFERKVTKWDALDPHLQSCAQIAAAAVIGCSWCMDFGYFLAHDEGLDEAKVREVPRWRDSDVFTPVERDVMAYAEAMSVTPTTALRPLLSTVAYEMLEVAADAEDVVHEAWLRWSQVDVSTVRDPAGIPRPDRHPAAPQPVPHRGPTA